MTELPAGTVTFLFTDLEGSTRLWEEHPEAMRSALARHDEILRSAIDAHGGHIVKMTGDGVHAAFATAPSAVLAARDAQLGLADHEWGATGPLRVRMGLHTGHAEARDGDYYGSSVNRAARLMSAANGGQIVVSLTTEELVRDELPDGVSLLDLGEQRLRDLSRPERTFQVVAPGLDATFAALRSLDAYPTNLPQQVTSFVGRERELSDLASAIEASRIVTLTGVGGVGKTRLATHVAADVLPRFADGAWLCELAAAADAEAMFQVISVALGVVPRPGMTLDASIAEFLHSKRLLLVLDNCEHLLEDVGRLVDLVLRQCADVCLLVTSREGLGVVGEQVWPLRSLPTDGAGASDAVRLFVDRARAARPGFQLDTTNRSAVEEICRRLDGIPLAIELAAARVAAMSPGEIAALLDERFRLLTGGRRTVVERHQTLRAAVDWSYSLLSPDERVIFERLGVFAGGFDAAAAAAVATGDGVERWDVLDALVSLVGKSMVVADEDESGTTRYQLLETLRQYAREQLDEAGGADDARRRHATHYAELAEAVGPLLLGPDEVAARVRVRAELDDLRAATNWAVDSENDRELAVRIVAAIAAEAVQDQGIGLGAWACRVAPVARMSSPGLRMAVCGAAACHAVTLGDYEAGRRFAREGIHQPTPADCSAPFLAYFALGEVEGYEGRPEAAYRLTDDARRVFEADGGHAYSVTTMHGLAAVWAFASGDTALARAEAEESLKRARDVQSPTLICTALFELGWALSEDEPEQALALLDESIVLTKGGAGDAAFAPALGVAASLRGRAGDIRGAVDQYVEAVEFAMRGGLRTTLLGCLGWGVELDVYLGRYEAAATMYGVVRVGGPLKAGIVTFNESPIWDAAVDTCRARLGSEAFDQAVARSLSMPYERVEAWMHDELEEMMAAAVTERAGDG